jgi:hypothetical protein
VSTELVTLQHFRDVPEALLAKGKLESAGIACALADGNLVRMDWLLSNAIGGIRLQVHKQEAESARAILDEPIPAEFSEDEWASAMLSRAAHVATRSISDLKKSIASGLMVFGCFCPSPFLCVRTTGNAIPAASNGWKSEKLKSLRSRYQALRGQGFSSKAAISRNVSCHYALPVPI